MIKREKFSIWQYIINVVDAGEEALKEWLKNMTSDPSCCGWSNVTELQNEIKQRLDDWHSTIAYAIQNFGYDGLSVDSLQPQWSFPATLLFTVTTIATIG